MGNAEHLPFTAESPPLSPPKDRRRWRSEHGLAARADADALLSSSSVKVSLTESTPSLEQASHSFLEPRGEAFTPPRRPSSTPYTFSDGESDNTDTISHMYPFDDTIPLDHTQRLSLQLAAALHLDSRSQKAGPSPFSMVPTEIHEAILDQIFGKSIPIHTVSSLSTYSVNPFCGTVLRNARRKEVTDLAFVSRTWRALVQQRLYRHLKIKATATSIQNAIKHFAQHPGLARHVKHLEVWFPVFRGARDASSMSAVAIFGEREAGRAANDENCSLEAVFRFITLTLPNLGVLTIEGGERRKAPKIRYFDDEVDGCSPKSLPKIFTVHTLIIQGQWNICRCPTDFQTILDGFPNLQDWHGAYGKNKSKSYISLAEFLPYLPQRITSVRFSLETDYRREASMAPFYAKVASKIHICEAAGRIAGNLESFSYTGRMCHAFFKTAIYFKDLSRLKSIDITLKNCCRAPDLLGESGSGINNLHFIYAFERLVLAGIEALRHFKKVSFLRIRFIDLGKIINCPIYTAYLLTLKLDAALPVLNPYFLIKDGKCSGVWSEQIVADVLNARPNVVFPVLAEHFGHISYAKDGRMTILPEWPETKVTSLKISNYEKLAGPRMTIH